MRINHNLMSMNTNRQLGVNRGATQKSLEKLSSGLRINRAGDDAAGLAISEKMRGQIRGLDQASRNSSDSISLIQTAEGALNETHSILQRMRELSVQAANDTNTDDDRKELQAEVDQLIAEIDRIGNTTEFNTKKLLDGSAEGVYGAVDGTAKLNNNSAALVSLTGADSMASVSAAAKTGSDYNGSITIVAVGESTGFVASNYLVIGADGTSKTIDASSLVSGSGSQITISASVLGADTALNVNLLSMQAGESMTLVFNEAKGASDSINESIMAQIGANAGQSMFISISDMKSQALGVNSIKVDDKWKASNSIETVNNAISKVSHQRSALGAIQNRLEHTINNLDTASENLQASESRIRDVDMAKEMTEYTKNNILTQAAQAMLAQANQQPQSVLQLLQ
ncbi:flagellin [Ruminiclostridium cellobioparum]|jgi:flagellin|uniref:flagellin N-terminal helical domain-containing protein n=1 Tax=Ruminiclostridium cellobioparum TaxID=29355 RepID=UPI00047F3BD6|nr:flagellin [Ruminiclostridium cellobioparum]